MLSVISLMLLSWHELHPSSGSSFPSSQVSPFSTLLLPHSGTWHISASVHIASLQSAKPSSLSSVPLSQISGPSASSSLNRPLNQLITLVTNPESFSVVKLQVFCHEAAAPPFWRVNFMSADTVYVVSGCRGVSRSMIRIAGSVSLRRAR